MKTFQIMDRVIFVGLSNGGYDEYDNALPACGEVYTIRAFVECPVTNLVGLLLWEIINTPRPCKPDGSLGERAWNIELFRPVPKLPAKSLVIEHS